MGAHLVNDYGPIIVISRSSLATFSGLALWLAVSRKHFGLRRGWLAVAWVMGLFGLLVTYFGYLDAPAGSRHV